ncbi:MAG: hypothetical protein DME40_20240 [Verrucomicrobia bacterium]|nr:MAG: hypothetical protein DME40_20240 [Verrucomicrobiota bacterium]
MKHGVRVGVTNLYSDEVGNRQLPKKFQALKKHRARVRWAATTAALLALGVIVAGIAMFSRYRIRSTLAAPEKSIAVLPFENLSEEKANAYFADGVQDEILTDLAKVADLKVISRTSVMQYKNAAMRNLREIAQQLGVSHVLEGSVQRAANRIRVNAQLIDARTDAHLWAEHYDRPLDDVFAIQSEIAQGKSCPKPPTCSRKLSPLTRTSYRLGASFPGYMALLTLGAMTTLRPVSIWLTRPCRQRSVSRRMQAKPTSLWPIIITTASATTSGLAAS